MQGDYKNGDNITATHRKLIEVFGEDVVKQMVEIVGTDKISFKPLRDHLRRVEFEKSLAETGSLPQAAEKAGIAMSSAYRILHLKILK